MSEPIELMAYLRTAAWAVAGPFFPQWEHHDDDVIHLQEVSETDMRITVTRAGDPDDNANALWEGGNIPAFLSRMLREAESQ
jgi:hypothetical protein